MEKKVVVPDITPCISSTGKVAVNQYGLDGKFIKQFASMSDATKALGISEGAISECIRPKGKAKSAGGFQWRKASEVK